MWNLVQAGKQSWRAVDDLGATWEESDCPALPDGRLMTLGATLGGKRTSELCLVPFSQNALARGAVHSAFPSGDEKVVLMHFIAGP